jgi:hypothetical protein
MSQSGSTRFLNELSFVLRKLFVDFLNLLNELVVFAGRFFAIVNSPCNDSFDVGAILLHACHNLIERTNVVQPEKSNIGLINVDNSPPVKLA